MYFLSNHICRFYMIETCPNLAKKTNIGKNISIRTFYIHIVTSLLNPFTFTFQLSNDSIIFEIVTCYNRRAVN